MTRQRCVSWPMGCSCQAVAVERFLPLSLCNRGDKTLQTSCDIRSAKLSDTVISSRNVFPLMMKLTLTSLILASSALVAGCAVYPDGTPAYATGGGYSAYPAPGYPEGYEAAPPPGYEASYGYGGPVVQSGVIVGGGGGYYGGPGPRYWNDSPGYRHPPPPGGWGDRGGNHGNQGGNGGGDRGGHGSPQAGGPQGGPQGGRPPQPQAGNPGRPAPAPQAQQSRGSVPYVGKSLWGKEPAQQPEHNH